MPSTTVTFFPVDNGDMTLISLGDVDASTILIDVNIRVDADDPNSKVRDVAKDLRDQLKKDSNGRPYVDAFLLSHPDQDHCRGLTRHFYLGPLEDYPDDKKADKDKKIVIRELWSSPIVFRRASKNHTLCDDAKAFNKEARRRVKVNKDHYFAVSDGDRIQIMGKDIDGKTDDLVQIVRPVDQAFNTIAGRTSKMFSARMAPPEAKNIFFTCFLNIVFLACENITKHVNTTSLFYSSNTLSKSWHSVTRISLKKNFSRHQRTRIFNKLFRDFFLHSL